MGYKPYRETTNENNIYNMGKVVAMVHASNDLSQSHGLFPNCDRKPIAYLRELDARATETSLHPPRGALTTVCILLPILASPCTFTKRVYHRTVLADAQARPARPSIP